MNFQTVREAAAVYQARGFRLVPLYGVTPEGLCRCSDPACKPRDAGKHEPPETHDAWKDGRTFTAEDFTEENNIALAMGPWVGEDSWLVALDVDGHDDVNAFFYPALPETLTQRTPRGAHFIFTVPERTPLGNWVDVFKGKATGASMTLDLRYARGRIVVAPSRGSHTHGNAGHYVWTRWMRPSPLPRHVIDTILDLRRSQRLSVQDAWERGTKQP